MNWAGLVLALALIGLFVGIGVAVILNVNDPPLLADVPASAAPSLTPDDGADGAEASPTPSPADGAGQADGPLVLEPQRRGAFDSNTRLLALLAIVSPMMTTLVAFYFGQRAGTAAADDAKQEAADATRKKDVAIDTAVGNASPETKGTLLQELRRNGII